jgi:glyoxylase-like metal-dependent hydrolase (beta-lactamase superfamily II)
MKHQGLAALGLYSLAGSASLLPEGPPSWHPGALQCTPETTRTEARSIDTHTIVLRQNPCVDSEANLVYVLVGTRRVLLIDTGAVEGAAAAPLVEWVQLARRGENEGDGPLPLLVVHTHGHRDHRAGDAAFAALPGTQIIAAPVGTLDLGDREVVVIPAPGHHPDHVVFYDGQSQSLFTGDFLLQGRLLVDDLDAYRESALRVAEFERTHPVRNVFGAHIELDITGKPFPAHASYHPNERTRPLTIFDVETLPAALADFNGFYATHPDFIVVNPIHNLLALATGLIATLVFLVWIARRLWKRRRA